ncbi:hypothetical protein [Nocardia sp. NPDC004722]
MNQRNTTTPDPQAETPAPEVRGLVLTVFRGPYNATRGVTATHDKVTVIGIVDETQAEQDHPVPEWRATAPTPDAPPVVVVIKRRFSSLNAYPPELYAFLRPVPAPDQRPPWFMHGGNYAGDTDSRFHKALERILGYPIGAVLPVHDRTE